MASSEESLFGSQKDKKDDEKEQEHQDSNDKEGKNQKKVRLAMGLVANEGRAGG